MDKRILNKLQETELDILCEIDRICIKNHIQYFIMYGTLLGAVRHKGFIPWDDDIDIVMPRKDYNRFLKIVSRELQDKYILDFISTNKTYYLPFAKIKNKNTTFEEKNNINYQGCKGIWVDIFPFDGCKINKKTYLFKLKYRFILLFQAIMLKKTLKINVSNNVINIMSKLFSNNFCVKMISFLARGNDKNDFGLYYGAEGIDRTPIFDNKDIFPLKKIEFCGKKFYGPNNPDKLLTDFYGDYMKLPSVEKRVTHNPLKIVFEDGETVEFNEFNKQNCAK